MTVDEIHEVSKIDHWFLRRLERITKFSKKLQVRGIPHLHVLYWPCPFFQLLYLIGGVVEESHERCCRIGWLKEFMRAFRRRNK